MVPTLASKAVGNETDGIRTRDLSLYSECSTTELQPQRQAPFAVPVVRVNR